MRGVLVTAIGSYSADISIKTLKKMGMRVVGCDIYDEKLIADAKNVDVFYQIPGAVSDDYIDRLLGICRMENISYILPLTDVEIDVINAHRKVFEDYTLCFSDEDTILLCRDKFKLYQHLQENGIKELIKTGDIRDIHLFSYPYIIKPRDGRSSLGVKVICDDIDINYIKTKVDISEYIVQPKICGDVVCVDVVCDDVNTVCISRSELLRTYNGAGLSVQIFKDESLQELCLRIAKVLGVRGCVNFEFIRDNYGKYHFLECNPRFSGGIEFSNIAGYNCVENHMNYFMHGLIKHHTTISEIYVARKYEEYITSLEV